MRFDESKYRRERTIFLRDSMENSTQNGRPPSGTRWLSREMMLGALIKWRLPYPAKEAARKKKEKRNAGSPLPVANEKLSSL